MLRFIIYVFFLIFESDSAKILGVFPFPSISHQIVFRPLMLELAKRGHDVTMITTDPVFSNRQYSGNFTEIDLHDISYNFVNDFLRQHGYGKDRIAFFELMCDLFTNIFEAQLKSQEVQNFLHDEKEFDLLIVESFVRPALICSHVYDVPVIEFSTFSSMFLSHEKIGALTHPLLYPNAMQRRFYNLTIPEKITELYVHYASQKIFRDHVHSENEMIRNIFGPNIPSLDDLAKNIHMLFINVYSIWDFNRPVPPNVLYLGGMHINHKSELPQEWKSYLDLSKNGIIYVSFGTNVKPSAFPPDRLKIFIDVFSKLPYDVLWKWDKDELPGQSENIKISKWLPQSDLLKHPKIKLFITQGGLQSTDEALNAGVPLIGLPILADQWMNTEHYVQLKIGKQLAIERLTEEELNETIATVINDGSYRENTIKLRNIMNDHPLSSLERAVWWTEYVIRHKGASHLRAPSAHLSWSEYYELELILLLVLSTVITLIGSVFAVYFLMCKMKKYFQFKVKTT